MNAQQSAAVEVPPKPKDMIVGGLMNRFLSDHAVKHFCRENEFTNPTIEPEGQILAWCGHYERWIPIGWTR